MLQVNGPNAQTAFESKGVDHLAQAVNVLSLTQLEESSQLLSLMHCLDALTELLKRVSVALKQLEYSAAFLKSIVHYLEPRMANQLPQPAMSAAQALAAAAKNDKVLDTIVKQGALVYAVQHALFYGAADAEQVAENSEERELNRQVRFAMIALIEAIKLRGNKRTGAILGALLTAEVLNVTGQPAEFVRLTDGFDQELKARLAIYLHEQAKAIAAIDGDDWREYSDNSFTFQ